MRATVLIKGPTAWGAFFIYDSDNRIWDGKEWRGFGCAADYPDYQSAFRASRIAKRKARHARAALDKGGK